MLKTPLETQKLITNFLGDFPGLIDLPRNDMLAQQCVLVSLPVEGRQEVMSSFELNEQIEKIVVSVDGAPNFDLCFKSLVYETDTLTFLKDFPGVKVLTKFGEIGEYIVQIHYGDKGEELKGVLEKLKAEYSDVVTVTN